MNLHMPDAQFLDHLDLSGDRFADARASLEAGDLAGAASAAADAMFSQPFRHPVNEADVPALASAIRDMVPRQVEELRALADDYLLSEPPEGIVRGRNSEDETANWRAWQRNHLDRFEGAHMLGRLHHLTGDDRYMRESVRMTTRFIEGMPELPDRGPTGFYRWHPHTLNMEHSKALAFEYLLHALPYQRRHLSSSERLVYAKAFLAMADFMFRACKDDVLFNLPLHVLTPALMTGLLFPAFRDSGEWVETITRRLVNDCAGRPVATADGYFGEGFSYQNVMQNLMLVNLRYLAASGRAVDPRLPEICERSFEFAAGILRNDGHPPLFGDSSVQQSWEHRYHMHEMLHLAAAYFRRADFKAAAGSPWREEPMEYNLWLMGLEGIEWHKETAVLPRAERRQRPHSFADSGFQVLGCGKGLLAHYGLMSFAPTHNHAHSDFGSIDISGLGRPLITDSGGRSPDAFSEEMHSLAALVRRTPLGPRVDNPEHSTVLFVRHDDILQAACMEHDLYENHVVRRTLALVDVDALLARDGMMTEIDPASPRAFWLVADRIVRTRPWPARATIPHELLEVFFHFNAPGTELRTSGAMTCWTVFDPSDMTLRRGQGDAAKDVPLEDFVEAHEGSTSDANILVHGIPPRDGSFVMDMRRFVSHTNEYGRGVVERPAVGYRAKGLLPFHAAFVLVPFRGVCLDVPVAVSGEWIASGGLATSVRYDFGVVSVLAEGLNAERPDPVFSVRMSR